MVPKKGHRLLHLQSPSSSNGATKNPTVTSSPSSFSYSFYITLLKGLIRTYPFHILLFCLIKLPEVGCHGNMLAKELTFMHDRRIQCKPYSLTQEQHYTDRRCKTSHYQTNQRQISQSFLNTSTSLFVPSMEQSGWSIALSVRRKSKTKFDL